MNPAPPVQVGAGNPINVITGNKYQREQDMAALPGVLGLEIVRHYNSAYSRPNHSTNLLGRGWKLSYETELSASPNALQIVQADGARIIFSRDPRQPSLCQSVNPADGTVEVIKTARGDEYRWRWPNGRELSFNTAGKLVQILAPGGQFVSLQHDRRGLLVKVTDPQGRSLHLHYPDKAAAAAGFRGVQRIDSPVGRFGYHYGSRAPKGAALEHKLLAANLVKVTYPIGARHYHYENPRFPTLLTGVSELAEGQGGKPAWQRLSTFGYDLHGRGELTVKGYPARLQAGADGKPLRPARLAPGTGIEQVTFNHDVPGQTTITNSLGQKTLYRHALVAGQYRLLEVRGVGCASCGEPNVRYLYDDLGRLRETVRLSETGTPLTGQRIEFDRQGRLLKVGQVRYVRGKAGATTWDLRYQYAAAATRPSFITRRSVVPGHDYVTQVRYIEQGAAAGMPAAILEYGYAPTIDGQRPAEKIGRALTFAYNQYGQRTEVDGPLPNAAKAPGPANSDVTRIAYDSRTKLPLRMTSPGNVVTEIVQRDAALRPTIVRTREGDTVQTATLRHNWRGQPEEIRVEAAFAGASAAPLARQLRFRYDARGRLVARIHAGNVTTRYEYDAAGRLSAQVLPDGSRLALRSDSEGRHQRSSLLDAGGAVLLPGVQFRYDQANRIAALADAEGVRQRIGYDEAGRVDAITNALDVVARFEYDADGFMARRTDAADSAVAATISLERDRRGHLTGVTDAIGVTTTRRYDDFGRKVAELNPDRGATLYRYDQAGRLRTRIDETASTSRYAYDLQNRLVSVGADANANLVRYAYQGRMVKEVTAPTERTVNLLNAFGEVLEERRLINRVDGIGAASGAVAVSQVTKASVLGFVTRFSYDDHGRMTGQVLPDGHRLQYRYGADAKGGQLEAIMFNDQPLVSQIDGGAQGLRAYTAANGIRQVLGRDARGQIARIEALAPERSGWWAGLAERLGLGKTARGAALYSQQNGYDRGGRLVTIARQRGAGQAAQLEKLDYDQHDRLTAMNSLERTRIRLEYDRAGNRVFEQVRRASEPAARSAPVASLAALRYGYARGTNQLIGTASTTSALPAPQYTGWMYHPTGLPLAHLDLGGGNPAAAPIDRRIVYNSAKRPIAVYMGGLLRARYYYNSQGERIAKTVFEQPKAGPLQQVSLGGGKTSYSLYREQRLAAETDERGNITAHYIYLQGRPVAKIEPHRGPVPAWRRALRALAGAFGMAPNGGAAVYAIHGDQLGTPQVVTDMDGQVVWAGASTPFGQTRVLPVGGAARAFEMNLRLPGQVFDAETGLHQNYYRDYDPGTGRYVTPDPLGLEGGSNPYAYVSNNPATLSDPLGLYQSDIHYYMTMFLGIAAGMDPHDARIVALAAQYVDDNPDTKPLNLHGLDDHRTRLLTYHFTAVPSKVDPLTGKIDGRAGEHGSPTSSTAYANITENDQLGRLTAAVATAGSATNLYNKDCTRLQLFGEYLHSFEDTFAHRDSTNKPFALSEGLGHGLIGSHPDYTYNHTSLVPLPGAYNWDVNEARTLQMQKEVYQKLRAFGVSSKAKSIDDLEDFLKAFNHIEEHEGKGYDPKKPFLSVKIQLLELKLREWDIEGVTWDDPSGDDLYNDEDGKSNRNRYLCDSSGNALDQKTYAGTILPSCTANSP